MEKHKKLVRVVCMLLAVIMIATLGLPLMFANAESPSEKLERLRKELQAIKADISATQGKKEKLEQTKQYYYAQANNLKAQLAAIKEDIEAKKLSIEEKNAQVAEKAASVEYNKGMFEQRLRNMYEMSRQSNLAILLGIDDPSGMLVFAENLQRISKHDSELVRRLGEEKEELEKQRNELDAQLAELSAREADLNNTAAQYSAAIQQADANITKAEADLAAQTEAEAEKQKQFEQAQREWAEWVKADHVDFEYNEKGFAWPIPGFTRLSSDFGSVRVIYGKVDVHRGMDVPAPAGTPIYAAADGVVSTNNHWSYGISVKISHGSGLATIYGHMSRRVVNSGDAVVQGQLIGYVGSTGNSTGNHLHFETNKNGVPVSSRPYLGPPWA